MSSSGHTTEGTSNRPGKELDRDWHQGFLRAAVPALGSPGRQLIRARASFSQLNGLLLTAGCRPAGLFPIWFGNTVSKAFQPGMSKAEAN